MTRPVVLSISVVTHHRTRVKICGITRPADAAAAAACGADAIGMIFYAPAPRYVTLETAQRILDVLPPFVTPVGVFVDASNSEIMEAVRRLGLRHVQLNGHEPPEQIAELRGLSVTKAIRVTPTLADELRGWRESIAKLDLNHLRGFVMETAATREAGGSGVPNDFAAIAAARRAGAFDGLPPLIVAGGLSPETVGDVVRAIRPWAVDVSSGVESTKGIKSVEKMKAFVRAVRDADQ